MHRESMIWLGRRAGAALMPATLLAIIVIGFTPAPAVAATCESLTSLSLPHTTVTLAQSVTGGSFTPPVGAALTGLPDFCRVVGASHPTADSNIGFEVWIPVGAAWNGKYLQVGNGGFAGSIPYGALGNALRRHYATAGTDDGHVAGGTDAAWALGHPEKIIDFGYRALKETTDNAKAIIAALTSSGPARSYFFGCSDGGREALMEAQRFPRDFDGIIAGAPANFWTHLLAAAAWTQQALLETPASYIPPSKLPAVQAAALAACDMVEDGIADGIVADPRDCHFDPTVVQCTGAESAACLTGPQVTALKKIYAGPRNPRTGTLVHPGYEAGAEAPPASFPAWQTGPSLALIGNALLNQFSVNFFRFLVFDNASYDIRNLNFDSDIAFTDSKPVNGQPLASVLNSTDPDLRAFQSHGGKLIHYHGWNDPAIGARNSINYYESVATAQRPGKGQGKGEDKVGLRRTQDFYRLFMVPGMLHCSGGPGPNTFGQGTPLADADHDVVKALEQWVERGIAPDRIVATKFVNDNPANAVVLTRPLCPYPQVALLARPGADTNDASNFICVDDDRGSTP
jgi:feruloyl esterase